MSGNEFDEEAARRARERLYHMGLSGTTTQTNERRHNERRNSDSDSNSEEMWPGTY